MRRRGDARLGKGKRGARVESAWGGGGGRPTRGATMSEKRSGGTKVPTRKNISVFLGACVALSLSLSLFGTEHRVLLLLWISGGVFFPPPSEESRSVNGGRRDGGGGRRNDGNADLCTIFFA